MAVARSDAVLQTVVRIRLPIVHYHEYHVAGRWPFVFQLHGEEIGQLGHANVLPSEQHVVTEQEIHCRAEVRLDRHRQHPLSILSLPSLPAESYGLGHLLGIVAILQRPNRTILEFLFPPGGLLSQVRLQQ